MQSADKKGLGFLFPLISILLSLGSIFFPLLLPVTILWSVYADARLGSFFATACTCAVLLGVGSVLWGWPYILLLLILIIPMVICTVSYRKGFSFADGLTYSLVGAFLCLAGTLVVVWRMSGTGPVQAFLELCYRALQANDSESLRVSLASEAALTQLISASSVSLEEFIALADEYAALSLEELWNILRPLLDSYLSISMPALVVIATLLTGALPWVMNGLFLGRRVRKHKAVASWLKAESLPPAFERWALPKFVWIACVAVLLVTVFISRQNSSVLYAASQALQIPAAGLLGLQGMSLAAFWLRRKRVPTFWRIVIILVVTSLLGWLMLFLGVWECTVKIRRAMILRTRPDRVRQLMEDCAQHPEELDSRLTQLAQQIDDEKNEEEQK